MLGSFAQLCNEFDKWASGRLCQGTIVNYRRFFDRFAVHVKDVKLEEYKPWHLMTWATKWHEFQAIQRLFNWAYRDAEIIDRNPFSKCKRPAPGQRHRILTKEELRKLLDETTPDFQRYLFALSQTMARPQEIRVVRWEDLRWPACVEGRDKQLVAGLAFFTLSRYKSQSQMADPHKPRIIPVSLLLGEVMVKLAGEIRNPTGPVFLNAKGSAWSKEMVRLRMKRLRKRLGFGRDEHGENIVCYTIRHTMATAAAALGIRDKLLADIMGHTTTKTTARYQHLQAVHLCNAINEVSKAYRDQ